MGNQKKDTWIRKLKEEIVKLQELQKILHIKNPSYPFLEPIFMNSIASMTDLLCYLEDKNPYYTEFNWPFFKNRQVTMHRTFISDLHIGTEAGLKEIIKQKESPVLISNKERVHSLVERIKTKLGDTSKIDTELEEIAKLGGNYPTFNDHLEAIFTNLSGLNEDYKVAARIYFHGINILRNKISHPYNIFSESERERLIKAKLGNALDSQGNMRMTFEGYKFLITDTINFFDTLYANI